MNPSDDSDDDAIVCSIVTVAVNFCSVCCQGSSQNKMDSPVAIPMSHEANHGTMNPEEGTMVSMTLSGETFHFCISGCGWLDELCVNDMSRELSMLVRGECIEDCAESCNWLHHRILTMNEPCHANGQTREAVRPQSSQSWTLSKGKEEPPLARPAFSTETAVFLCKLNICFSFRHVMFRMFFGHHLECVVFLCTGRMLQNCMRNVRDKNAVNFDAVHCCF
jgi:hypothetical protein